MSNVIKFNKKEDLFIYADKESKELFTAFLTEADVTEEDFRDDMMSDLRENSQAIVGIPNSDGRISILKVKDVLTISNPDKVMDGWIKEDFRKELKFQVIVSSVVSTIITVVLITLGAYFEIL